LSSKNIIVIYDFDGVLVDSYWCLSKIYSKLAKMVGVPEDIFTDIMLSLEDIADYLGIWDKKVIFNIILNNIDHHGQINIDRVVEEYWKLRIKYSRVIDNIEHVLKKFRDQGIKLYIVSGMDDTVNRKVERIKASGLSKYFDKYIIYGKGSNVRSLREALKTIIVNENVDLKTNIYYIDDKPLNLLKILDLNIKLVHYVFKPPFPKAYSWFYSSEIKDRIIKIYDHEELHDIIFGQL